MEDNKTTEVVVEETNDIQKYIDTINELKANSVSRSEYDKIRNENTQLLTSLVNGKSMESAATAATPKPSAQELRKELYGENVRLSNLDYWEKTLALRDAVIEETGKDPFVPYGKKITATEEDISKANKVAEIVRECIDVADGDSNIFTMELQRRTNEGAPVRRRR